MAFVFILGMAFMLVAPLLRRYGSAASWVLAAGAFVVVAVAIVGLAHPDVRQGLATVEANRRFYLIVLACEVPVLALALVSQRRFKGAFWAGWIINVVFALLLIVMVIWLAFSWHW